MTQPPSHTLRRTRVADLRGGAACELAEQRDAGMVAIGMWKGIQIWFRRRKYREGRTLSHFIARDVRRDIEVVSAARIEEGLVTVRVRTTNLLYVSKGLAARPEFEGPVEMRLEELWKWSGQSWGGLPDGTSLVREVE